MAIPIGFLVYLGNGGGTLTAVLTSLLLFLGEIEGRKEGRKVGMPAPRVGGWVMRCLPKHHDDDEMK